MLKNIKWGGRLSQRNSNIEILRIFSMILIIAYHIVFRHSNVESDTTFVFIVKQILGSWGILGVDLFLIISAWFLIEQKFRSEKVFSFVFQVGTWIVVFLFFAVVYYSITENSIKYGIFTVSKRAIKCLIFEPLFLEQYWYASSYFFLLLMTPVLNKLISSLSKINYQKCLLLFIFIPLLSQPECGLVVDTIYFAYIYFFIGYIKKYELRLIDLFSKLFYIAIIFVFACFSKIYVALPFPELIKKIFDIWNNKGFDIYNRHSVLMLIEALLIFFYVKKIEEHNIKWINFIASGTFGIYLFHENVFLYFTNVGNMLYLHLNNVSFFSNSWMFIFQFIGVILCIFIFGFILEYLRMTLIQKPIFNILKVRNKNNFERIDSFMNCI